MVAGVEVGADLAEAVEGEAMAVEDEATMLVDTCKEDMVEVVRIFHGLREERGKDRKCGTGWYLYGV